MNLRGGVKKPPLTLDQHRDLAAQLGAVRGQLMATALTAPRLFGKTHRASRMIYRLVRLGGRFDALRSELDNLWCRDFPAEPLIYYPAKEGPLSQATDPYLQMAEDMGAADNAMQAVWRLLMKHLPLKSRAFKVAECIGGGKIGYLRRVVFGDLWFAAHLVGPNPFLDHKEVE